MKWPSGNKGALLSLALVVLGYILVRKFLERQLTKRPPGNASPDLATWGKLW